MIVFDTETTGLVEPEAIRLDKQPQIIEFAAIKLDEPSMKEVDRIEFLVNPVKSIPFHITKITNINDKMVRNKPTFAAHYNQLVEFFLGESTLVAHNASFDVDMMKFELMRMDKLLQFPWPSNHICTVECTMPIKGHRLSLTKLYEYLFEQPFKDAHRAMGDVEALTRCVIELRKRELI